VLPAPSTAEFRAWARARDLSVSDRGRLRPEIHAASSATPARPTRLLLAGVTAVPDDAAPVAS
jgi:hypothetical protein